MSVVPSVNASSGGVLPGFFGAPAAESGNSKAVVDSASLESHSGDSRAFSSVLEQSAEPSSGLASNPAAGVQQDASGEAQKNDLQLQRLAQRGLIDEQQLAELSADEILPLANQIVALSIATEAPPQKGLLADGHADDGEIKDPELSDLRTTQTIVDGSEVIAIPVNITQPQKLASSESPVDNSELDSADASLVELDQREQDRGEPHRDAVNVAEVDLAAGSASAEPNTNIAQTASLLPESESVQQLRTSLETELGVRPDRTRPADNRASNLRHVLQSASPNSKAMQSNGQSVQPTEALFGADRAIKAPVVAASDEIQPKPDISQATTDKSQSVDSVVRISPANKSLKQSSAESLLPNDVAGRTSSDLKPTGGQRPPMTADSQQQKFVFPTPGSISPAPASSHDQMPQLSATQPAVVGSHLDSAVTAAVEVDSDSTLQSSVNAGVARTGLGDSDTEESQVDVLSVDGIETPDRRVSQGTIVDRAVPVTQSLFGGPAVVDAQPLSASQLNAAANPESMPLSPSVDDTPTESVSDVMPVIDSDLELLQQLLPRDTTAGFGQAADSSANRQAQSLALPTQIAARVVGEAEVLETGESTRFRMKLDPPELGSVLVDMQKTAQGTTITVTAADPATQQLLHDSLQQLSQSDSDEPSVFDHLNFDLSSGEQGDGQESDGRKSHSEKIRIAANESSDDDSESTSQSSTELDFVA